MSPMTIRVQANGWNQISQESSVINETLLKRKETDTREKFVYPPLVTFSRNVLVSGKSVTCHWRQDSSQLIMKSSV